MDMKAPARREKKIKSHFAWLSKIIKLNKGNLNDE